MSISGLFIRRPVATTLVMLGILMFGMMAYRLLPVSDLPNVDFPTITVSAGLPGASPQTMAAAVATPLEKQFSTIAGLDAMTSSSTLGSTNITLQFTLSRNIDAAAQDVQSAISKTLRQLPPGIQPPSYQKVNPADSPILYLALTSTTMPLPTLDEYAETFLAQRLSTVSGVAQVQVYGSQKYAVRIQVDPKALATRGIGLDEVTSAVSAGNPNLPTGTLWGPQRAYTVLADGSISSAPEFRKLAVTYQNGTPVRLEDVARVLDDVQDNRTASWFDGRRAIVLAIQRQPGTNTVQVADAVKATVAGLTSQLPASVEVSTLYDRSTSIRQSVNDVQLTLFITLCLVVLVIFLFLRNLSATVIPSLALPFSIIGTFSVMYLMGYSLDNLSLMALTLSVGFVVDDAIVMLENIVRHLEMGKRTMEAALDGAREIGFTIVSMTLSLTAVFIPILLMGGIMGRLFHEFAVTIGVAILVSGFVSLTLTPMLCSRFLRPPKGERHGRWYEATERIYQRSLAWYARSLNWVMDHRPATMIFSAGILVAMALLFVIVPKGFIPTEDTGQIQGTTETLEGSSYEAMRDHQLAVADILRRDPYVDHFMSTVGGGTMNQGRVSLRLKPRGSRPAADAVIRELMPKLNNIPGIRTYLQVPPVIRIGGRTTKTQYQFTLQSADIQALYDNAAKLEAALRRLPTLQDVTTDLQIKNPQVSVRIDRDRATSLGVSVQQIEQALYDAYGSRQVSTIYTPNNQYWVIIELLPEYQRDPAALQLLHLRSQRGNLVPLTSVASASPDVGPLSVNHSGQLPSVTLSFNLPPGVSLGAAVNDVQNAARQTLPSTISTGFSGTAQAFQASQQGLALLLLLAVVVIYIVLGILYESFVHPLTILSGLPFAGFGALLTLVVFRTELSVYAFVGVIMLVGLVKKNAIMMIDFALDAERNERKTPRDAILQAASVRFRPIMMTTMAALMGTLPIAIGWGAGAESRRPLGLAVVGGLAFSQIITLYVTPVVYTYLDALQQRFGRRAPRSVTEPAAAD
ncbi:MAG: acriflavine resistance protein B [Gemmatimonadetes bacterium 13_2_20CM_2_65_7]|nr:MAG: acriflavine resistance protein B [Gemmatimonadetes bacterium 13_2_20CM_2_65_7]